MQDGTFTSPRHLCETASQRGNAFSADCPTRQILDRIADKWSVLILMILGDGAMRFSGLKRRIDGVSQKMLSQTLRSLERDGLVLRHVEPSVPVSVTYSITPLGQELVASLRSMIDWAETRMSDVLSAQRAYDGRDGASEGGMALQRSAVSA
ncbi:winged helix-turn-helix transcriptional regulator [Mangrovicella endophytica]|uniref:winged helix-turn-helix transcriptional regulator n=1 Tax=Mangrovicella endophytica TaxID=2066697 RepID=UPI000C9E7C4F|nr:helix-turn-helix domain-containing protein [Mangrovicella endophytica]